MSAKWSGRRLQYMCDVSMWLGWPPFARFPFWFCISGWNGTQEIFLWETRRGLMEVSRQVLCSSHMFSFICWLISLVWGRSRGHNCSAFPWILLQLVQLLGQVCVSHLDEEPQLLPVLIPPRPEAASSDMDFGSSWWAPTRPVGSSLSFALFYFTVTYMCIECVSEIWPYQ